MKKTTQEFINQQKLVKQLDDIHKRNVRNFHNYFKYSGKVEEYKPLHEFECNKSKSIIDTKDPLIRFYLENSDMPIKEMAIKFGYKSDGTLRKKIRRLS